MQTVSRFFARVDIVMAAAYRESSSKASNDSTVGGLADRDVFFVPMINEVIHRVSWYVTCSLSCLSQMIGFVLSFMTFRALARISCQRM